MKTLNCLFVCGLAMVVCCGNAVFAQETLRHYADLHNKNIGVAVHNVFFADSTKSSYDCKFRGKIAQDFNMLVAENAMKPDALQARQGEFDFVKADSLIRFAERNKMKVRGHCLVWHEQLPKWMKDTSLSREQLLRIMELHISTVVSHFKGHIAEWDVVNEAVEINGSDNFRHSIWYKTIGPDFIDSAFVYAHRADPDALLFYNDYGAEDMGVKSNAVFALVKRLKTKGIPIHGLGLQSHFTVDSFSVRQIDLNMKRLDSIGLLASITELDIRIPSSKIGLDEFETKQAKDYGMLMALCLRQRNCQSILFWGVSDKYSWIPGFLKHKYGAASILKDDYTPKKAYYSILNELKN